MLSSPRSSTATKHLIDKFCSNVFRQGTLNLSFPISNVLSLQPRNSTLRQISTSSHKILLILYNRTFISLSCPCLHKTGRNCTEITSNSLFSNSNKNTVQISFLNTLTLPALLEPCSTFRQASLSSILTDILIAELHSTMAFHLPLPESVKFYLYV